MGTTEPSSEDDIAINAILAAVRQAADVVCDRWTLALLLQAMMGVSRSGEFRQRTGMASRQLSQRLKALEAQEIVVRMPYSRRPLRYGTHLTTMGEALFDVFICMLAWEQKYCTENQERKVRVSHKGCNNAFATPELVCGTCEQPLAAHNVVKLKAQRLEFERLPVKVASYRRTTQSSSAGGDVGPLAEGFAILGDKWTIEILVILFMGVDSFVGIQRHTGISSNVLTDRLTNLLSRGVLRQATEGEQGRIGSYRLTRKGFGFYPILLAIQAWADAWLPGRLHSPLKLEHQPCARPLALEVRCATCLEPIAAAQCQFEIG